MLKVKKGKSPKRSRKDTVVLAADLHGAFASNVVLGFDFRAETKEISDKSKKRLCARGRREKAGDREIKVRHTSFNRPDSLHILSFSLLAFLQTQVAATGRVRIQLE